jgi:hypothetical protein
MTDISGNGFDTREQSLAILADIEKQAAPESGDDLLRRVLPVIGQYIASQLKPLRDRIAELEASGIRYCGVYQRAADYKRGDVCTHDGSMWVSTCPTPPHEVPGKSVCWQLSVKSK